MPVLFQGSPLDIYVHWLILALGIGIFLSLAAVATTCRSFSRMLGIRHDGQSPGSRMYLRLSKYHSYYWGIFAYLLSFHLMVTLVHLGLPKAGEPFFTAHQVTVFSALGNIVMLSIVFSSCMSFNRLFMLFSSHTLLTNKRYQGFYKYHSYFWWVFLVIIITHITFGMVHSINT